MKRIALLLMFFAIGLNVLWAQTREIRGTVTSADDGSSLPGVSVSVKGTTLGTITDMDGAFRLKVPQDAKSLIFSFVGMVNQEVAINNQSTINVKMASQNISVDEVVVTALGISRDKKALGYSVAEVKGDELLKARGGVSNPINSLAGKVAGLQITSASGNMGGSSKIILRGVKSISGNNQPLFVIDGVPIEGTDFNTADAARGAGGFDYGNLIQDINPDDIESMSVLKGPNASALYGSRANNGVIMITTKKGAKNAGLGVTFNTSAGVEMVNKLPIMQKEYGGGYALTTFDDDGNPIAEINGTNYTIPDYSIDESWGPKYDANTRYLSWYDVAKWEAGGKVGNPTTSPWVAPQHDIKDFFELGHNFSNNISVSQATEYASVRASYTNSSLTGYMPNSSLDKNSFSINATATDKKVYEVFTNINYLNQAAKGRPETGYGDNNVMQKFIQWGQRQLDMEQLKNFYMFPDGTQAGWNRNDWNDPSLAYSNNPYWSRYKCYQNDTRDRLYGNIGTRINLFEGLKFQYKLNLDYFSDKQYERNAVYSQELSSFYEASRQQHEINHEFMLMFSQKSENFSMNVNAGSNIMYQKFQRLSGASVGGIVIPDFYNLSNSVDAALATNYTREKEINSVFASANFGYKNFAYLDATARNDWSSSLPNGNNSYFYPSVTGSIVFSELIDSKAISFGKIRAGWAKVGNDTDPYRIDPAFSKYTSFEQNHGYVLPTARNNDQLKPEQTYSYEAGLEMSFFNNRFGFDLTGYSAKTVNQIIPLSLSGTTGYTSKIINAGEITNKGIELALRGTPVKSKDFEWNIVATGSSNKNEVVELLDGVDYYRLVNAPFKVEVGAFVGKEYGVIMGTDYIYDDNGNKVVGDDGLYLATSGNVPLGTVYPKLMAGVTNTFRYKNVDLSVLFDGQWGGKFFSTSYMWGMYSGMLEETAGLNELGNPKRDDPAEGGGVLVPGVTEDGAANTTRVDAETWATSMYTGPAVQNVFKSDFIKLREVTIGYTLPIKSAVFKNVKVSAYGRNLALWGPDTRHFDPEMATTNSGNIQGIEGGALPSVATYGINLGVQF
ncbi:MAG: SusC/RagA family TonB-linked outer membrane protein [Methylococcaceae bacterium]|nr:SusC/RagA family TonB-linked outer membrane protein [Prolixibacteraceae bacterium]